VTAVADSSPLVILTKLDCLDFLNRVFPRVYISNEVHYEVVIAGAGVSAAMRAFPPLPPAAFPPFLPISRMTLEIRSRLIASSYEE
jgi:hypothetical protein